MKDQETGVIEGSIATEENFTPELQKIKKAKASKIPKVELAKIIAGVKQKILSLKKPKFITIIILFVAIILVYVGLVVFLAKQPKENQNPSVILPSSTPGVYTKNLPDEITNKKTQYYQDLESLDGDLQNLFFPQTDLNMTF